FNQGNYKITASDIVRKVTEELTAKRVVTQILDNRASVGIGVGLEQLLRSRVRKSSQEQRGNAILPRRIDNGLMCKNGIPRAIGCAGHSEEKYEDQRLGQEEQNGPTPPASCLLQPSSSPPWVRDIDSCLIPLRCLLPTML